jgi:RHS repeat-associated protein
MEHDGALYYLFYDHLGSLRRVTDADGTIVKQVDYDAFGQIVDETNSALSIPLGFAGGLHDRSTGLVRFGFRDYDPEVGRWTAKDPIFFEGGDTDLYGYSLNNPVSFVDISGLAPGDPYGSISQAARAALRDAYRPSITNNWEYGGYIIQHPDGFHYTYTEPKTDKAADMLTLPCNPRAEADYHTHGAAQGRGDEFFSPDDMQSNDACGYNGYLMTPSGKTKMYLNNSGGVQVSF